MRGANFRDEKAIREIYDKIFPELFVYLRSYTSNVHDIEDVIQDVFLKLLTPPPTYILLNIRDIRSYIFRSVRNTMLNRLRDRHRVDMDSKYWETILEIEDSLDVIAEEDVNLPDVEDLIKEIDTVVDSLPPQCRQIFIMSKKHGMKYREIAETLRLSPKTVENQIGIALKKIREGLKKNKILWGDLIVLCLLISKTLLLI